MTITSTPQQLNRAPIRGWHLLFVLHGILIAGANVYTVVRDSHRAILFYRSLAPSIHGLTPFVVLRLTTSWLVILIYVTGLMLVAARSSLTLRYWRTLLPVCVGIVCVRIATQASEHFWVLTNPAPTAPQSPSPSRFLPWPYPIWAQVGTILILAAWWMYWKNSTRATKTFEPIQNEPTIAAA